MTEPLWPDSRIEWAIDEIPAEVFSNDPDEWSYSHDEMVYLMRQLRDEYEAKLVEIEGRRVELVDYIIKSEGLL